MGVKITDIVKPSEVKVSDLKGKIIAIDSSLFLYQFISTIRQRDGSPLTDSKGAVTSHLTGLFFRTINLMKGGLKLAYVFDGKTPELKRKERERRSKLKDEAEVKYKIAVEKQDIAMMKKYASRTSRLTSTMVEEAKELISSLGLPIIQAPGEAEAQAAHMVKKGDCFGVASQDFDTLMFGSPVLVRNLSMLGKRKKAKAIGYSVVKPEVIRLSDVLNEYGIDKDQLIVACMLIGTDFNVGGVKGIGPKNAIKAVKRNGKDFDKLFEEVKWAEHFDTPWTEIYYLIKRMPVTDEYTLRWGRVNETNVYDIMVNKHDFSKERIESGLDDIRKQIEEKKQKSLFDF